MTKNLGKIFLRSIASLDVLPNRFRPPLLRWSGVSVGRQTWIFSGARFTKFANVSLEDDVYINHDCYFDAQSEITVGARSSIGDHVRFVTATHVLGPEDSRAGLSLARPIVIGPGTWIGSSVVILPGVTVGSGCVIAAGSIVTGDCERNSLYAGVPARRVKRLPVDDEIIANPSTDR